MSELELARKRWLAAGSAYYKLGVREIQAEARKVLAMHPGHLNEFVMGMGTAFFTGREERSEIDDEFWDAMPAPPYDVDRVPGAKRLNALIDRFNEAFNVCGDPMRFTATGPVVTNW